MNILRVNPKNEEEKMERYQKMLELSGNSPFMKRMIKKKMRTVKVKFVKEPLPF